MDPQLSDELSFIMTFLSTVLRREQTDEKVTLPFFFFNYTSGTIFLVNGEKNGRNVSIFFTLQLFIIKSY